MYVKKRRKENTRKGCVGERNIHTKKLGKQTTVQGCWEVAFVILYGDKQNRMNFFPPISFAFSEIGDLFKRGVGRLGIT